MCVFLGPFSISTFGLVCLLYGRADGRTDEKKKEK